MLKTKCLAVCHGQIDLRRGRGGGGEGTGREWGGDGEGVGRGGGGDGEGRKGGKKEEKRGRRGSEEGERKKGRGRSIGDRVYACRGSFRNFVKGGKSLVLKISGGQQLKLVCLGNYL